VNVVATLFGTGVALRLRTMQAGPAMQMPVFLLLFLAPVFVPRELLSGWVKVVSGGNPMTAFLDTERGFIAGSPDHVLVAYGAIAGLLALMTLWAARGMRSAARSA
jgi:ABC-2 type transport system permease protein